MSWQAGVAGVSLRSWTTSLSWDGHPTGTLRSGQTHGPGWPDVSRWAHRPRRSRLASFSSWTFAARSAHWSLGARLPRGLGGTGAGVGKGGALQLVSHGRQVAASVPAGPGQAADHVEHLELERGRLALGSDGLGHLTQNLVPVSGRVAGRLDLLLVHILAVHLQLDAGGGDQQVELVEASVEDGLHQAVVKRDSLGLSGFVFVVERDGLSRTVHGDAGLRFVVFGRHLPDVEGL